MKIHQLTVHYDPSEDRLLLRIGTTDQAEIQAWLTRRMTLTLAPHLPKVLSAQLALIESGAEDVSRPAPAHAAPPPAGTKPEATPPSWLNQSDLSGAYRSPVKILQEGAPLLVTDIDLKPEPDGLTLVVLKERRPELDTERKLELRLEPQLLQGLQPLITESLPKTEWTQGVAQTALAEPMVSIQVPPKHLLN